MMKRWIDLKQFRSKMQCAWSYMTTKKRLILVSVPVVVMITLVSAMNITNSPSLLNLITADQETVAEIVKYLDRNGIAYTLPSDTTIQVPEAIKAKTLLALAENNLIGPQSNSNELFDEFSFGMTSEMSKLHEIRALESKIARTIVDGDTSIKNAYVSIERPKDGIFKEDQVLPSAHVKLVSNSRQGHSQVKGIQNLVAAAVARMRPENVVVVDSSNNLLSRDQSIQTKD